MNENEYEACPYCDEEVTHLPPDGISFCHDCGIVEGQTVTKTYEDIPSDLDARYFVRED